METEELTPDQSEQELEPEVKEEPEKEPTETQGDDPLDTLEGEDLRAEAKKYRSIAQRKGKEKPEVKPEPKEVKAETKETPFVTKSDMARIATREALELAGDEIKANYDELVKVPLGGFDPLDANSIASNLKERLAIFKARGGEVKEVPNLATTKVVQGSGKGIAPKTEGKELPNFRKAVKPEDWYPKKES